MFNRFSVAALATVLIASSGAAAADSAKPKVKRGATTTTSVAQTVEGNRYVVTTTVKSPKQATSITLQKLDAPDYSFQDPDWDDVTTIAVRGRNKIRAVVVATEKNTERYRTVVRYKKAKPFTSKPATVKVWRWIPLSEYDAYYETGGTTTRGIFGISGRDYVGFGPSAQEVEEPLDCVYDDRLSTEPVSVCTALVGASECSVDDAARGPGAGRAERTCRDAAKIARPTAQNPAHIEPIRSVVQSSAMP